MISEDPTQSGELRGVSHDGAGGVRVDVSHVRGFDSRVGQSGAHRQTRAVSVTGRLRDVVRVARLSVPSHLRIRNRATTHRIFKTLQHQHTGALAHDETAPSGIERSADRFRVRA